MKKRGAAFLCCLCMIMALPAEGGSLSGPEGQEISAEGENGMGQIISADVTPDAHEERVKTGSEDTEESTEEGKGGLYALTQTDSEGVSWRLTLAVPDDWRSTRQETGDLTFQSDTESLDCIFSVNQSLEEKTAEDSNIDYMDNNDRFADYSITEVQDVDLTEEAAGPLSGGQTREEAGTGDGEGSPDAADAGAILEADPPDEIPEESAGESGGSAVTDLRAKYFVITATVEGIRCTYSYLIVGNDEVSLELISFAMNQGKEVQAVEFDEMRTIARTVTVKRGVPAEDGTGQGQNDAALTGSAAS